MDFEGNRLLSKHVPYCGLYWRKGYVANQINVAMRARVIINIDQQLQDKLNGYFCIGQAIPLS